jgi:hypothetical protein
VSDNSENLVANADVLADDATERLRNAILHGQLPEEPARAVCRGSWAPAAQSAKR